MSDFNLESIFIHYAVSSETSIPSFRIMLTLPPTFAFLRSDYQTTLPGRPSSLLTRERNNSTTAERIFMTSDDMTAVKITIPAASLDLTFRGPWIVIYSCNKS
jgi:hypothetical protein